MVSKGLYCDNSLKTLYERGESCADIARRDGRSETTIYLTLKSLGVQFRSRSEANKIVPDSIMRFLYNLGLSSVQVAMLLDIHPTTVTKRLESCGFPARPRDTARRISYSSQEFELFFRTEEFRQLINMMS